MIKLGEGYYDEASIIAITPSGNPRASDIPVDLYTVYTVNGQSFRWDADAAEVQRRLEEVGLIEPEEPSVPLGFPPNEMELLADALEQGYQYAAKDLSGQVFAYCQKPSKGKAGWSSAMMRTAPLRLHGEFAALSWDDEEPLDIAGCLEPFIE